MAPAGSTRRPIEHFELDHSRVNQNFSCILEIHRHPVADRRLDLTQPPIRALRVPYELAGLDERRHRGGDPERETRASSFGRDFRSSISLIERQNCAGGIMQTGADGISDEGKSLLMQDPLQIAELFCARICHDLSGPLGTLMGATELALEEAPAPPEALSVAADSAASLGQRLRLLRAAWGGDAGPLDVARFQELADGLTLGKRVKVDLSELEPASAFAPAAARLALNVLLMATEAVAGNGRVAMSGSAAGDILVTIDGPRAAWPEGLAQYLTDEDAALQALTRARTLQGPLTALLARRAGSRLSILMGGPNPGTPPPLLLALATPP